MDSDINKKWGDRYEQEINDSFLVLSFLTTFVFADRTSVDDGIHNQIIVIEQKIDN
jgi:hypothetical protein